MIATRKEWILNALVMMPILLSCCSKREKNEICVSKTLALIVLPFSHTPYIYMQVIQRLKIGKKSQKSVAVDPYAPSIRGVWRGVAKSVHFWSFFISSIWGVWTCPVPSESIRPFHTGCMDFRVGFSFVFLDESIPFLRDRLQITWKRYIK